MKEILVQSGLKPYYIYLDNNMDKFNTILHQHKIKSKNKLFMVIDSLISEKSSKLVKTIQDDYGCLVCSMEAEENNRIYNSVEKIYDFLIENNADKESILVSVGDEVIGDITGYAAATFMGGIKFIRIPTTLTSQINCCVQGEVGYYYKGYKNLIRTHYDPMFVFISINFLHFLEKEQLMNGIIEVIKLGLIKDKLLLNFLNENYRHLIEFENDKLTYIIKECIRVEDELITEDKKSFMRFGNKISNALQINSDNNITFGVSTALGLLATIKLSEQVLGLNPQYYNKIKELYNKLGIPTYYKVDNYNTFLYAINRSSNSEKLIDFILLQDLNQCADSVKVNSQEITKALKESICEV